MEIIIIKAFHKVKLNIDILGDHLITYGKFSKYPKTQKSAKGSTPSSTKNKNILKSSTSEEIKSSIKEIKAMKPEMK